MVRVSRIALACVLALGAAGISAAAYERQPEARLAREWVAAASAFESYTTHGAAIRPGFASGREVAKAVSIGAAHEPQQLEAGMVAYAALAAVQEPAFTAEVQRIAADPRDRADLIHRLVDSPESVMGLAGAEPAAGRAQAALIRQIEPLVADGQRVKQAAYDIQHSAWSKARIVDAPGRLAKAKALSSRRFEPADADAERLFQAVTAGQEPGGYAQPTPLVVRGLALAALALAGAAGDDTVEAVRPLMSEPRSASCVRLAKLNLFQCMAVAGPHYEDVFCLGQHAMIEPGQCMAQAVGRAPDAAAAQRTGYVIPASTAGER
jgi:hypothetical protein